VHQRFKVVYVDEYEKEPTKGQLNKKFGLYVERDFFLVSQMSLENDKNCKRVKGKEIQIGGDCHGRYLDLINNRNMVIKSPNGRKTQTWYFHQQSLTIRTRYNN
jgi:hypothetical protein